MLVTAAVHHREHLLHPVVARDSDVVLDQWEEAPEGEEHGGLLPHRGARRGQDQSRPYLVQLPAPGEDDQLLRLLGLRFGQLLRERFQRRLLNRGDAHLRTPCSFLLRTKWKTPASWLVSTSGLPVARDHALKSGTEPGSVAKISNSSPDASSLIALAVLMIGSGHDMPFRFRLIAIVM